MKNSININKLIRKNILELTPYNSARGEFYESDFIFLDANENPFPLGYNRYPDPLQKELKEAISIEKEIPVQNIFLGNGSDEIIDLLYRAFCYPGKDSVIINTPTYGMYELCARVNDIQVIKINLDDDFQIDLDSILKANLQAKMIFICSPNNPTGNIIQKDLILELLSKYKGIVIIDEAYIDFANNEGFASEINKYTNLIVLQTFSKARAMAGVRLGMAFMNSEIVGILNKIKHPYNISYLNQKAILKSLKNKLNEVGIKAILKQKEWLTEQLGNLKIMQKIWPSDANFLLVKFFDHDKIFKYLRKEGIIVRDRSKEPGCEGCLRITIGKSSDNQLLINCLKKYQKINL